MKSSQKRRTTRQIIEAIEQLDLGPIKFKLMDPEEGEGWSRDFVEHLELQYKRYLTLVAKYPHEAIAPAKEVDKFWHAHILDTRKYVDDCGRVFGFYLHHFPYFGLRGGDDAAALARAGQRTRELYEAEFGAAPGRADRAFCSVAGAAFCSASTGPVDTRTRPSLPPLG
jgi:hypothetical protein